MKNHLPAVILTTAAIAYYIKKKYEKKNEDNKPSFNRALNSINKSYEELAKIDDLFEKHQDNEVDHDYQEFFNKIKDNQINDSPLESELNEIKEVKYNPLEELKAEYQAHSNNQNIKEDMSKIFITENLVKERILPEINPLLKFQVNESLDFKNDLEIDTSNDIVIDSKGE